MGQIVRSVKKGGSCCVVAYKLVEYLGSEGDFLVVDHDEQGGTPRYRLREEGQSQ